MLQQLNGTPFSRNFPSTLLLIRLKPEKQSLEFPLIDQCFCDQILNVMIVWEYIFYIFRQYFIIILC